MTTEFITEFMNVLVQKYGYDEKVLQSTWQSVTAEKEKITHKFASLHEITFNWSDWNGTTWVVTPQCDAFKYICKTAKKYATKDWVRGDVIGITNYKDYGYRNMGKYMWNGKKLVELDTKYDDYGHVPNEFLVGKEFNAMYWFYTITHNELVYSKFIKKDMKNVKIDGDKVTFDYVTHGIINTWCLVGKAVDNCWTYYDGNVEIPKGVKPEHVLIGINYESDYRRDFQRL